MRKTFTFEGKRYSVQRKTKRELDLAVAEKISMLKSGKRKESSLTFAEYASRWQSTYKTPYVSYNTDAMYTATIKSICKHIGNKRLKDISTEDLQNIITEEMTSKSRVDKIMLTVRQIYKQAEADRLVNYDPTKTLKKPKLHERHRRALSDEECRYIMTHEHPYRDMFATMLLLGLRPMEVALIQKKDIKDGYIHIRGTKTPRADRYIPIPEALFFDLRGFNDDDYLFTSKRGNALTRDDLRRIWEDFRGHRKITMYMLRHTYGTRAQQAGVPIDVLADLMGHEKIETTRKYYIDDNFESKERQRERLNKMWT